jgi:hypothetical protein
MGGMVECSNGSDISCHSVCSCLASSEARGDCRRCFSIHSSHRRGLVTGDTASNRGTQVWLPLASPGHLACTTAQLSLSSLLLAATPLLLLLGSALLLPPDRLLLLLLLERLLPLPSCTTPAGPPAF